MIHASHIEENEGTLIVRTDVTLPFHGLEAEGRMLVDSDGGAFVYLLGHGEEFVHLRFEENTWNEIHTYRQTEKPIYVSTGIKPVELEDFWTEIDFLLDNIRGNQNYGKEFVNKIEKIFMEDSMEE
ncbi:hypothetical protein [Alkalicoccus saliphilus]|jgi:hypothetical protein|uniref:Uncharacterized protein n=1 Tax=Alkalicoccus saliphilus TaxID=200989 RepID=A0A2T4U9V3_9BACI|nr:hypothetical protein [Alkalicoccus saliphilus]PTL40183.1 hypothetical protein C6Y45_02040 [Alkalicoccus saliphilus]